MMALAMLEAKTPDPSFYNAFIPKVVGNAPGATQVNSFKEGMDAIAAGKTINYVGAGGPIAFDQFQNSTGAFELVDTRATRHQPAARGRERRRHSQAAQMIARGRITS